MIKNVLIQLIEMSLQKTRISKDNIIEMLQVPAKISSYEMTRAACKVSYCVA